ncbi:signal recognition particle protein, partial [bacterium]|nr:signal recognition particle protein [bacterium]
MFSFLADKFSHVLRWVGQKSTLTEANIAQAVSDVRTALLDSDVPLHIVESFLNELKTAVAGSKIIGKLNPGEQFIKIVHDTVLSFLGGKDTITTINFQLPSVVMVMGLQGSGKTTTVGKLAHFVKTQALSKGKQRRILVASVDYYRPAAIDQLEIVSQQAGVDFYRSQETTALAAAKDIYNHFKSKSYELLFLDTAGRLQIDTELMG